MPPKQERNGWNIVKESTSSELRQKRCLESKREVGEVTPMSMVETEMQKALREGKKKRKEQGECITIWETKGRAGKHVPVGCDQLIDILALVSCLGTRTPVFQKLHIW